MLLKGDMIFRIYLYSDIYTQHMFLYSTVDLVYTERVGAAKSVH